MWLRTSSYIDKQEVFILKRLIYVLIVIILITFGLFYNKTRAAEAETQKELTRIHDAVNPLLNERLNTHYDIEQLNRRYAEDSLGTTTSEIIFTSIDSRLYTKAYPIMKRYDMTGVMALSVDSMPGEDDNISFYEFKQLVEAGWTYCVVCTDARHFDDWLEKMDYKIKFYYLTMPEIIYFPDKAYSHDLDEKIAEAGFTVVVHHGEERQPVLVSNSMSDGLWLPGAVPMNTNTITAIADAYSARANIIYTVSFDSMRSDNFDASNFTTCLRVLNAYMNLRFLYYTDILSARASFVENEKRVEKLTEEYEADKAELENKVIAIDDELNRLYASFGYSTN